MTARRVLLGALLVFCGFAVGLVLTGRMRSANESAAQAPAAAPSNPVNIAGRAAAGLPDFSSIASATVGAVTNISSTQVVRRPNSPFSNDPFFQYFFGDNDELFGSRRGVESSLGSGVIVSPDGYVLTNNHVVAGESGRISLRQLPEITIALADKRELKADIVGVDQATDLALLKIDAHNLPTVPWG